MRIVQISTFDLFGGAARAAHRLHRGLLAAGHDSRMMVRLRRGAGSDVVEFQPDRRMPARIRRWLRAKWISSDFRRYAGTRPAGLEPFTDDRSRFAGDWAGMLTECGGLDAGGGNALEAGVGAPRLQKREGGWAAGCDVINLHWVAGDYLDYRAFFASVPAGVPVVWTLHDMNAFTGGCHYDGVCGRFMDGCGLCPQLGSTDGHDLSRTIWERKKAVFDKIQDPARLHVVALCGWMSGLIRSSPILGRFSQSIIPNGLDTEVFRPLQAVGLREALGIPEACKVVLFASDSLWNQRKGLRLLTEALKGICRRLPGVRLVCVGGSAEDWTDPDVPVVTVGHVQDDRLLALLYSAADVFVIPSLQDNLPNTVMEAMACGVPVVGFDTGGIPDMVRPGKTGWLAPVGDVKALAGAIVTALGDDEGRRRMGVECRETVLREYTLEKQAKAYVALYEGIGAGRGQVTGRREG